MASRCSHLLSTWHVVLNFYSAAVSVNSFKRKLQSYIRYVEVGSRRLSKWMLIGGQCARPAGRPAARWVVLTSSSHSQSVSQCLLPRCICWSTQRRQFCFARRWRRESGAVQSESDSHLRWTASSQLTDRSSNVGDITSVGDVSVRRRNARCSKRTRSVTTQTVNQTERHYRRRRQLTSCRFRCWVLVGAPTCTSTHSREPALTVSLHFQSGSCTAVARGS